MCGILRRSKDHLAQRFQVGSKEMVMRSSPQRTIGVSIGIIFTRYINLSVYEGYRRTIVRLKRQIKEDFDISQPFPADRIEFLQKPADLLRFASWCHRRLRRHT